MGRGKGLTRGGGKVRKGWGCSLPGGKLRTRERRQGLEVPFKIEKGKRLKKNEGV